VPRSARATRGLEIVIPGWERPLRIDHVVLDFNGTLAVDGRLVRGTRARLRRLAAAVDVVVLTADTFGTARRALDGLDVMVRRARSGSEKRRLIASLDPASVAAIGNGKNDVPMLRAAALSVAVIGGEGACVDLLQVATVVVREPTEALDLLLEPRRLMATLRL